MIKAGDKVKFLNDVGGGVVTRIINKNTVAVENEDGFEIPTLINQLVLVDAVLTEKQHSDELLEQVKPEENKVNRIFGTENSEPSFYLAFVPDDIRNPLDSEMVVYFVNDSSFQVMMHFSYFRNEIYQTIEAAQIGPKTSYELDRFTQEFLSNMPDFCFQLVYFSEENTRLFKPISKCLKVNPVKFYKETSYAQTPYFRKNAMQFAISENILEAEIDKLTDEDFKKVVREKELISRGKVTAKVKSISSELIEVDLHIHELLDDTTGLSNRELLEVQMDRFKSEMESAIRNRAKKIVFIHGVGNGTLKTELHKALRLNYKKYYFQDASFKEYGYGATMVILRKG